MLPPDGTPRYGMPLCDMGWRTEFEPSTAATTTRCSTELSYEPIGVAYKCKKNTFIDHRKVEKLLQVSYILHINGYKQQNDMRKRAVEVYKYTKGTDTDKERDGERMEETT